MVLAAMKNMSTLYQHLRSELVPPRVKALASAWQVWDSAQEKAGDTIHIEMIDHQGRSIFGAIDQKVTSI